MGIDVFAADEQSAVPVDTIRWIRLAHSVLQAEGVRGDAELSMLFVDEEAMADLNQRFLGADGSTDVLAFPLDGDDLVERGRTPDSGGSGPGTNAIDRAEMPMLLGDVVICPTVAERNAPSHMGTYDDEMALLVVHGILHLLGMDHAEETEAQVMQDRERDLLKRFHKQ
jgi:probable rRNA maturation factor